MVFYVWRSLKNKHTHTKDFCIFESLPKFIIFVSSQKNFICKSNWAGDFINNFWCFHFMCVCKHGLCFTLTTTNKIPILFISYIFHLLWLLAGAFMEIIDQRDNTVRLQALNIVIVDNSFINMNDSHCLKDLFLCNCDIMLIK